MEEVFDWSVTLSEGLTVTIRGASELEASTTRSACPSLSRGGCNRSQSESLDSKPLRYCSEWGSCCCRRSEPVEEPCFKSDIVEATCFARFIANFDEKDGKKRRRSRLEAMV